VFSQAPVAIAILRGPLHVYELANPPYLELVGGRELVGKAIRDAIPELEGQGVYEILDTVYATGQPFRANAFKAMLVRGGAKQECFFDLVYHPMFHDGRVEGIAVVAFAVTGGMALAAALFALWGVRRAE